jgi:hypothetical protein
MKTSMTGNLDAMIVRYRVAHDRVAENIGLIESVFAELEGLQPTGFRYATFVLDDGETFVHVAMTDAGTDAPLPGLASFRQFRAGLEDRSVDPPAFTQSLTTVGAYGLDGRRQVPGSPS